MFLRLGTKSPALYNIRIDYKRDGESNRKNGKTHGH